MRGKPKPASSIKGSDISLMEAYRMSNTDWLDKILGQLLGKSSVEFMNHPDGKKIVMPADELYGHQQAAKQAILNHIDKALKEERFVITEEDVIELHGHNYFFENNLDVDYSIFLDDKRENFTVGDLKDIPYFSYQNADRLIKNRIRQQLGIKEGE